MCDGNIQISISQLRQTRHFGICNEGGEGLFVKTEVVKDMEAIIAGRTVRV